jgi:hypothetical protein
MNYEVAEGQIVTRLNSFFAEKNAADKFEAILRPDNTKDFTDFVNNITKTRLSVGLIEITPEASNSIGAATQEEVVRFRMELLSKNLRGPSGLFALMPLVKEALIGFKVSNASRLTFVKYGVEEFDTNVWTPYFEFECKAYNVQLLNDYPDDIPIGGNVSSINTN